MKADDLDAYLSSLGQTVEVLQGADGLTYTVVRNFSIPVGSFKDRTCDLAIHRPVEEPYVCPAAIHVRPHLVAMDPNPPLATQQSKIGSEWQYWSRRFDRPANPKAIWAHVLTIFKEV